MLERGAVWSCVFFHIWQSILTHRSKCIVEFYLPSWFFSSQLLQFTVVQQKIINQPWELWKNLGRCVPSRAGYTELGMAISQRAFTQLSWGAKLMYLLRYNWEEVGLYTILRNYYAASLFKACVFEPNCSHYQTPTHPPLTKVLWKRGLGLVVNSFLLVKTYLVVKTKFNISFISFMYPVLLF